MKYIMNISLTVVLLIYAFCINVIYGSNLIGFAVLMGFTFMGIIVLLAAGILYATKWATSSSNITSNDLGIPEWVLGIGILLFIIAIIIWWRSKNGDGLGG